MAIILNDIQLIATVIIIKIMKEPILPNFLPFKATLPITMQKYIKVKEEIMLHIYINYKK